MLIILTKTHSEDQAPLLLQAQQQDSLEVQETRVFLVVLLSLLHLVPRALFQLEGMSHRRGSEFKILQPSPLGLEQRRLSDPHLL